MKDKKENSFPLYVERILSSFDVRSMNMAEFGCYMKLLIESYIQEKPCFILNNDVSFALMCNMNLDEWNKIKEPIIKKFSSDGIYIYNNVLLETWKEEQRKEKKINKANKTLLTNKLNYTFDAWWNDYDYKVGYQPRIIPRWINLTDDDREKIRTHTPIYKEFKPEKQFRKKPENYIKERVWEDEIVIKKNTKILDYGSEKRIEP